MVMIKVRVIFALTISDLHHQYFKAKPGRKRTDIRDDSVNC